VDDLALLLLTANTEIRLPI